MNNDQKPNQAVPQKMSSNSGFMSGDNVSMTQTYQEMAGMNLSSNNMSSSSQSYTTLRQDGSNVNFDQYPNNFLAEDLLQNSDPMGYRIA